MTDKWQCCICKQTKVQTVRIIANVTTGKESVDLDDHESVKCCFRRMRNLTEAQYINESSINDSGARDK